MLNLLIFYVFLIIINFQSLFVVVFFIYELLLFSVSCKFYIWLLFFFIFYFIFRF